MLIQRLVRSTGAWRPLAECAISPRVSHQSLRHRRQLHQFPVLPYESDFVEHGVRGLLSPDAFKIAWTDYQTLMVQRLNEITAGFEAEHSTIKQLVLQYARNPATAALFNHASMAHNNHFFFGSLSPAPSALDRHTNLKASLENTFGSIETLQQTMLTTADAMFGPGFVWLVATRSTKERAYTWRILNTYLAGTPYAEAGYRQQGVDMNVQNTAGAFGSSSASAAKSAAVPPGGALVEPVLCVSTWEHVYLRDFGVAGKQAYLQRWWDLINWSEVENRTPNVLKGGDTTWANAARRFVN